jgi:hypothetical protein
MKWSIFEGQKLMYLAFVVLGIEIIIVSHVGHWGRAVLREICPLHNCFTSSACSRAPSENWTWPKLLGLHKMCLDNIISATLSNLQRCYWTHRDNICTILDLASRHLHRRTRSYFRRSTLFCLHIMHFNVSITAQSSLVEGKWGGLSHPNQRATSLLIEWPHCMYGTSLRSKLSDVLTVARASHVLVISHYQRAVPRGPL